MYGFATLQLAQKTVGFEIQKESNAKIIPHSKKGIKNPLLASSHLNRVSLSVGERHNFFVLFL